MKDIDIYDQDFAGAYSSEREKFLNADQYSFEKLEQIGLSNKVVVDIGCGDGRHAQKIYELGASKVIGVDNSEAMVALAGENATADIVFGLGEASDTSQEDEVADLIFSNFVIHYINDLSPVFAEFNRILKKGGKVVMTFNIFETADSTLHNTEVPLKLGGLIVVTNLVKSHSEITEALESNAFTIDSYEAIDSSYLSIDDTFENKGMITDIKNILCVATKN